MVGAVENNRWLLKRLAAVAHFVSLDGVCEVVLTLVNDGGVDGSWSWLWW